MKYWIDVVVADFGAGQAVWAGKQMLFQLGKFGLILYHSKVIALQIVVQNVFHGSIVGGRVKGLKDNSESTRSISPLLQSRWNLRTLLPGTLWNQSTPIPWISRRA
jgi:hypothetical protein